ncbi:MAG TPA: di-heme oxidoredictase family protein, partial [Leptospiraceae bacterium]|nr:di-heme oxidoredictase family protein [Leptospiraceae bacterium]
THPEFPELSNQTIYPYTDLLLHDMGKELADQIREGSAEGNEWRTPPLWGLGLYSLVNQHSFLLHDGRARNAEEAVLWHGGEAEKSRDKYRNLRRSDREKILDFLYSL